MAERTVAEENEIAQAKLLQRWRTARDAFLATFGPPEKRTPFGLIMLEHLERFCRARPGAELVVDNQGQSDIPQKMRHLGRKQVIEAIHEIINWKETTDQPRSDR